MNKELLAKMIDGAEYPFQLSRKAEEIAKEFGLVIVVGYSDDGVALMGAIRDEVSAWEGTEVLFTESGLYKPQCEDEDCPHEDGIKNGCRSIHALWCQEEGYSWTYQTDIPHSSFDVLEDGGKYCRGIVFNIADLAK